MATVKFDIDYADGWVEVAASTDATFAVENQGLTPLELHYADSLPATTAPGHDFPPGALMPRVAGGNLYVRCSGRFSQTTVIISK